VEAATATKYQDELTVSSLPSWPVLTGSKKLLCLGAHSDDIEIGCGGTLVRLAEANPDLQVTWIVFAPGSDLRRREAERSVQSLLGSIAVDLRIESFRERYLPYDPALKQFFDSLAVKVTPDLVMSPRTDDLHQDHRVVAELARNTFRHQPIWEYEIVKYEGDLGNPNLFVTLSQAELDKKVSHILSAFPSQAGRHWFASETFTGLARIRGIEARSESGYAEAFHARKMVLR
jgi:LmbE family N-acetylglucosaminyl deacetylase